MLLPQQAGGGAGDHATGPLAQAGHWRCPGSAPDMASRPRRPQGHPQGSCQKCGDQRGDGVPCGPSNEEGGHHGAQNQRANDSAASGTRLGEAVPMRRGGAGRGLRVDARRLRGYYPPGGGGRGGGGAMRKVPPARGGSPVVRRVRPVVARGTGRKLCRGTGMLQGAGGTLPGTRGIVRAPHLEPPRYRPGPTGSGRGSRGSGCPGGVPRLSRGGRPGGPGERGPPSRGD